jgi:hypothetical protein
MVAPSGELVGPIITGTDSERDMAWPAQRGVVHAQEARVLRCTRLRGRVDSL